MFALIASAAISDFSGFYKIDATTDIWDGTTASSYAGGAGTESNPYLISSGAQLYKMVSENTTVSSYGKYFKLTNDIYLNDVVSNSITSLTSPRSWYSTTSGTDYLFCGTFDGADYTIYGLYVNGGNRGGLFPQIGKASIKNVRISKSYIASQGRPAAIAGAAWTGSPSVTTITNCHIDSSVTVAGVNSAAGIVAYVNTTTVVIDRCSSLANLSVTNGTYGGIIGATSQSTSYCSATISNCWTSSSNIYSEAVAGIVTATACSSAPDYKITGLCAMANMPELDWAGVWEVTDSYPKLRTEAAAATTNPYWDGTAATEYAGGDGTKTSPYLISNAAQLYKMVSENGIDNTEELAEPHYTSSMVEKTKTNIAKRQNELNRKYFELTNNIYINDVNDPDWISNSPTNWYIGNDTYYFNDIFNGKGYTIYGLYVSNSTTARGGLFPQVSDGAVISNVRIRTAWLTGNAGRTGAIAGTVEALGFSKPVTFKNIAVVNTVVNDAFSAAGIVGTFKADCTVTDSYFRGVLQSTSNYTGGIAADGWSGGIQITNCYTIGAYPMSGSNSGNYGCTNVYTDTATGAYTAAAVTGVTTYTDITMMQGNAARSTMQNFNWNTVWCVNINAFPSLYAYTEVGNYWDGTSAESYAGGTGTKADPYLISNAQQLYKLVTAGFVHTNGKYYKLTNDININRVRDGWQYENPRQWNHKVVEDNYYVNAFCGYFDGNGYTVSGLYNQIATTANRAVGLFQVLGANAVIRNVNVSDVHLVAYSTVENDLDLYTNYAGAIAGYSYLISNELNNALGWPQIVGCTVTNSDIRSRYAGGIIGGTVGGIKINACAYTGTVTGYTQASAETDLVTGGIIGNDLNNSIIANCYTAVAPLTGKATGVSGVSNGVATTDGLNTTVWNITETGPVLNDITFKILNNFTISEEDIAELQQFIAGSDTGIDYYITLDTDLGINILDLITARNALVYELAWSEEFDGDSLDEVTWGQEYMMGTSGDIETDWNNASVSDGKLKLRGTYNEATGKYAVANTLTTKESMSFRYGKLEMSAKVPVGAGVFPSLWFASKDALGWQTDAVYTAEVDIFEIFAQTGSSDTLVANAHKHYKTDTVNKNVQYKWIKWQESFTRQLTDPDAYHTFTFEWTPDTITASVDGNVYMTIDLNENWDLSAHTKEFGETDMSQFRQPMRIMINNHMYTPNNGQSKYQYTGTDPIVTPIEYDIEYIRLYQKPCYDSKLYLN